jgi:surface carbohydrate biosynthesis protein
MIDFEVLGDDGTQFGWPLELPKDGAFWTHSLEAVRIEEVLNNVALSTDLEWKVMSRDIAQELITFDSGNSLFARMMAQI